MRRSKVSKRSFFFLKRKVVNSGNNWVIYMFPYLWKQCRELLSLCFVNIQKKEWLVRATKKKPCQNKFASFLGGASALHVWENSIHKEYIDFSKSICKGFHVLHLVAKTMNLHLSEFAVDWATIVVWQQNNLSNLRLH